MSFSFAFSTLMSLFAVLLYALRFCVQLYNRARVSFVEKDFILNDGVTSSVDTDKLVSILVSISHVDFIVPLLHALRTQSYKRLELLVAISHGNVAAAHDLKDELITLHREYVPHIPLMVFAGGERATQNVQVLASAVKGEYLCMMDERTRLAPHSVAAALQVLKTRNIGMLCVIPHVVGASRFLASYGAVVSIAFGMRRSLVYVPQGTTDVFSCMRAGDYYKYFLHHKGHRKYTRDGEVHRGVSRSSSVFQQHVFSSLTTYHLFSAREYLQWFVAAFRKECCFHHDADKQGIRKLWLHFRVMVEGSTGVLGAWLYLACFIGVQLLVISGMFISFSNYALAYALICLLGFMTHYVGVCTYDPRLHMVALQWIVSPLPYLHAFFTLSGKGLSHIVRTFKTILQMRRR